MLYAGLMNEQGITMKYYVCRKMRLLEFLSDKGFRYIKVQQDRKCPSRDVWIYEKTDELMYAVEEYYNRPYFTNETL